MGRLVDFYHIWLSRGAQGRAQVAGLAPRGPGRRSPLAARRRLARPVAGGRLAAVAAVPSHLPFQFSNTRLGLPQQLAQHRVPLHQLGVLGCQLEVLLGQLGILHFQLRDSLLRRDHALTASWAMMRAVKGSTSRGQYSTIG